MNALMNRSSLFDDIFKDLAPAFYVRPLHGDPLPTPAQIKVDVTENDKACTVQAEVPGVGKPATSRTTDGEPVVGQQVVRAGRRLPFRAQLPAAAGSRPGAGPGQVRQRRVDADAAQEGGQRVSASDD